MSNVIESLPEGMRTLFSEIVGNVDTELLSALQYAEEPSEEQREAVEGILSDEFTNSLRADYEPTARGTMVDEILGAFLASLANRRHLPRTLILGHCVRASPNPPTAGNSQVHLHGVLDMSYICPVCGFPDLHDPPRSAESGGASYEICPSCGFEFGVSNDDLGHSYEEWRDRWIEGGMHWASQGRRPPNGWDPRNQVRSVQ